MHKVCRKGIKSRGSLICNRFIGDFPFWTFESLKRKIVGPCCSILQSLDCLPAFTHSPRTLEKCYCSALCPSLDTLRLQCASGQLQTDPCGVCLQCAPGVSTAPARPLKILTLIDGKYLLLSSASSAAGSRTAWACARAGWAAW